MYSIYRIYCSVSGLSYVGKTKDISRRWEAHRRTLRKGEHHSHKLQEAYQQHGADAFEYHVLEQDIERECVSDREAYWVKEYDCLKTGYNVRFVTQDREDGMPRTSKLWTRAIANDEIERVSDYEVLRKQIGKAYEESLEEFEYKCIQVTAQKELLEKWLREAHDESGCSWELIGMLLGTMKQHNVPLPDTQALFEELKAKKRKIRQG